jgi:hypothetical protein
MCILTSQASGIASGANKTIVIEKIRTPINTLSEIIYKKKKMNFLDK